MGRMLSPSTYFLQFAKKPRSPHRVVEKICPPESSTLSYDANTITDKVDDTDDIEEKSAGVSSGNWHMHDGS